MQPSTDTILAPTVRHLTIHDVAARYATSRDSVYRWLRKRESDFPRPIQLPTSGLRWVEADLDAWDAASK